MARYGGLDLDFWGTLLWYLRALVFFTTDTMSAQLIKVEVDSTMDTCPKKLQWG
jgi:hypothetical protein